jgi:hypothetical protein
MPAAALLAAVALPLAAAGVAQASAARYRPSLPGDYQVSATLTLNVNAGTTVSVVGGGGGTSNCTTNETNTTLKVTTSPVSVPIGFTAKNSGSCFFEPSYSNFVVTVKNGQGQVVAYRTIQLYGYGPLDPYKLYCSAGGTSDLNMNCRVISDREIALYQTGGELGGGGGVGTRDYHEDAYLRFNVGGPGPMIHVEGGGGGPDHSNCTNRETNTTSTAGSDPSTIVIGFDAKTSGSCSYEASYSYFSIKISGKNSVGTEVNGTARIRFGQPTAGGPYSVNCVSSSANVSCRKDNDRLLTLDLTKPQP